MFPVIHAVGTDGRPSGYHVLPAWELLMWFFRSPTLTAEMQFSSEINFYRRVYNSPDAKWSKSKENLAQKATRYLCALGKLEHSVSATIHHLFNPCFSSQGPATSCSLGYGIKSVNKMIESWCENGVDNWGSPTEAKIYCDRGYYNNPKAAQVRSRNNSIELA